jgi:hypothetical protein
MKKIVFILTIVAFVFTSCGSGKKKENMDTHTHEDGTVHRNDAHDHENETMPAQESFEVEADSAHQNESDSLQHFLQNH